MTQPQRPYNFAPGPAVLPDSVLQQAAAEMLDWHGSGTSVLEMSHRGVHFLDIQARAMASLRALLGLGDEHAILFLQGGASAQNAIVPLNLLGRNAKADFVDTGHWSQRSIAEARKYGDVHVAATAQGDCPEALGGQGAYTHIPDPAGWSVRADAAYLHLCGNETIGGVEFHDFPGLADPAQALSPAALAAKPKGVPLVVDMSSHILSRPMDFSQIDLAYGGAQKNIGPSGLTFVIVKKALIEQHAPQAQAACPSVFDYRKQLANDSMLNTPPTYAIYLSGLVFDWLTQQGGVAAMGRQNAQKAALLYGCLDSSDFYQTRVAPSARSWMNVPFFLPDERLYEPFLAGAKARGLLNLKGHKAVGGLRASIYNAMPLAGVQALVDYLQTFEKESA